MGSITRGSNLEGVMENSITTRPISELQNKIDKFEKMHPKESWNHQPRYNGVDEKTDFGGKGICTEQTHKSCVRTLFNFLTLNSALWTGEQAYRRIVDG